MIKQTIYSVVKSLLLLNIHRINISQNTSTPVLRDDPTFSEEWHSTPGLQFQQMYMHNPLLAS